MASQSIGVRIGVEGGPEYIRELRKITQETKTWKAEFDAISKSSTDPFLKAENSIESLNRALENQEKRLGFATDQLNRHAGLYGENAAETSRWREEVYKAAGEIERLKKQIESFSTQKINIEGVGELKRDLETLSQTVSTFDAEFRMLSSRDGIAGVFDRASGMKDVLTKQISTQQEVVRLLEEDYQKAVKAQGEFSEDALKMKEKVADATTELNRMSQELRELPNGWQNLGDQMLKTGEQWTTTGQEFKQAARPFWGATAVAAAGITGIIKETQEFEKQMSAVAAVTNASNEDIARLTKTAREVALSSVYSATEVGEGMEILGRAGLDANQTIETIGATLAFAAANELEMADAARILVDNLSVFQLDKTLENTAHFADVFSQTARSANTDAFMIGETAKYTAPSFAALGWSVEDAAFALGLAADYGVKSTQAGTGLRQMLVGLEKPTDKAALLMERFGVSLDDGTGNAVTFEEYMRRLRAAFGDLEVNVLDANGDLKEGEEIMAAYGDSMPVGQLEKLNAIATIFGTRALPTVLALINTGTDDYNELAAAVYNADGAAQQMADTMIDNLAGQWTLFIDSVKELALEFGEVLLPVAKDFVGVARDIVDGLHGMDANTRELILKGGIILGLVGPLLSGIGNIFTGIGAIINVGGHLSKGIGGVIKLIGGGNTGFIGSLFSATSTMGTATTAAGTLAGGKGIGAIIATAGPYALAAAAIVAAGVLVAKNWGDIKEAAKVFAEETAYHFGNLKRGASEIWGNITETVAGAIEFMDAAMRNFGEGAAHAWNIVKEAAVNGVRGALEAAGNLASGIWNTLNSLVSTAWSWGESFMSWLAGGLWSGLKWVREAASSLFNALASPIATAVKNAWTWGKDMMSNLKDGINGAKNIVTGAVKTVAGGIKSLLGFSEPEKGPLSNFHTYMPDMMKLMAKGIRDNIPLVQDALGKTAYALLPSSWVDLPASDGGKTTNNNLGGVTIVINAQPGQDVEELADLVERRLISSYEREVYAYG